jgi:hypothetical protein
MGHTHKERAVISSANFLDRKGEKRLMRMLAGCDYYTKHWNGAKQGADSD